MENTTIPEGYIRDYISGELVKAGPEQIEAVQIFSRRLVEEYGYVKDRIQTRPQFRIKQSPSGREKYPVDIAVFHDSSKTYDNLYMIVECKRKTRLDGEKQLKIYMGLSSAQIGIWFNGQEHLYIHKILDRRGNIKYEELPVIPKNGQRLEDIGRFTRKDLKVPANLKAIFRDVRNHLAGMTTGITRDEALAQQLINLLFCKIYDEINTLPDEQVTFRASINESPDDVKKRIVELFETKVKVEYNDVFDSTDTIVLDSESIVYVVGELQNYLITKADRDALGDAFEVFIGPALRGSEGQFFTPRNVVKMMIDILDPKPREHIIDPACGSGGFLIVTLQHVWKQLEDDAKRLGWSDEKLGRTMTEVATRYFRGIDKDSFLAKVTKAYMAIIGDGRGGVFCENSLRPPLEWDSRMPDKVKLGMFDVVITNPPHGARIQVRGETLLSQFELAHKWQKEKGTHQWKDTGNVKEKQAPQILFIERCLQLLKPGGRMGIILPESLFGNPTYGYIPTHLQRQAKILGIVSMPEELFQPYTHNKTCVLFLEKNHTGNDYPIFMSIVKWCGHDSRGNPVPYDEVPQTTTNFLLLRQNRLKKFDHLGFVKKVSELVNNVLIPKYYDPDIRAELEALRSSHDLITVGELVANKVISVSTGDEVGRLSYGTGVIPFIRTSDISNWELKIDPKHGVDKATYLKYNKKQDVREHDILMVRDGTYLVGTTCMITSQDTEILFQSHIYRIRVLKPEIISPFLLLALLNAPIVKKQIKSKQFTQDIIDTLGGRITELVLPVPKDKDARQRIVQETRTIVEQRSTLRKKAREVCLSIVEKPFLTEEEKELISTI